MNKATKRIKNFNLIDSIMNKEMIDGLNSFYPF